MLYPTILMIRYNPAKNSLPYRTTHVIDDQVCPSRNLQSESRCRPRLLDDLEKAWSEGARSILILGSLAWYSLGISFNFERYKSTLIKLPSSLNPQNHPWKVIGTIDPLSKYAYVRNGYGTYKADLAKLITNIEQKKYSHRYEYGKTPSQILSWLDSHPSPWAIDIETDNIDPHNDAQIVCLSIASSPEDAIFIPWQSGHNVSVWSAQERALLENFLSARINASKTIWHNGVNFDIPFMILKGFKLNPRADFEDTLYLHKDVEPQAPHSLGSISNSLTTRPFWKEPFIDRPGSIYKLPIETLIEYNATDACATYEIFFTMKNLFTPTDYNPQSFATLISRAIHKVQISKELRQSLYAQTVSAISLCSADLLRAAALPDNFNLDSDHHLNAFIFNHKKDKREREILSAASEKLHEIELRKASFEASCSNLTPGRKKKELDRFDRMLRRASSTATIVRSQELVNLLDKSIPLFNIQKLGLHFKINSTGLFSFNTESRQKLLDALESFVEKTRIRLKKHLDSGTHERFITMASDDLESSSQLLAWLKLYETRQKLQSFADLIASDGNPLSGSLEILQQIGSALKAPQGRSYLAIFYTSVTPNVLASLSKILSDTIFPLIIRHKTIILEVPCSGIDTSGLRPDPIFASFGQTLGQCLQGAPDGQLVD